MIHSLDRCVERYKPACLRPNKNSLDARQWEMFFSKDDLAEVQKILGAIGIDPQESYFWAQNLFKNEFSHSDNIRLLRFLGSLKVVSLQNLIEQGQRLSHQPYDVTEFIDLLLELGRLSVEDRSFLVQDILLLAETHYTTSLRSDLVRGLKHLPAERRRSAVFFIMEKLSIGHQSLDSRIAIVKVFARVEAVHWDDLVSCVGKIGCENWDGLDHVLEEVVQIPCDRWSHIPNFFENALGQASEVDNQGKQSVVHGLAITPPAQWSDVLEYSRKSMIGRFNPHHAALAFEIFAQCPAHDREHLLKSVLDLVPVGARASLNVHVIDALHRVKPAEREEFSRIVRPLVNNPMISSLGEKLLRIAGLPAAVRAKEADWVLNLGVDQENVGRCHRSERTKAAFNRLKVLGVPSEDVAVERVSQWISRYRRRMHDPVYAAALECLTRDMSEGDSTDKLIANPPWSHQGIGLAQLAAFVERMIGMVSSSDPSGLVRDNLQASFDRAIAQCIEDGHRVCDAGISQRLLIVLQGYYPGVLIDIDDDKTPHELLSYLCTVHRGLLDHNSAEFHGYALKEAGHYYKYDSNSFQEFRVALDSFFSLSMYES